MKKGLIITLGIIVAIIFLVVTPLISTYNGLVTDQENVSGKWKQVENQMQRRYDLIPNLIGTVKGYAAHENEIFTEVAEARTKIGSATGSPEKLAKADAELTSSLSRLLMITENYPQLKADTQFLKLQDELAGTENRMGIARKDYNESVQSFNAKVKRFPTNIIANVSGFQPLEYFDMADKASTVPTVNFSDNK